MPEKCQSAAPKLNENFLMTVQISIVMYCYSEQHTKYMVFVYVTYTNPLIQELARGRLVDSPGWWRQTHHLNNSFIVN